jgi:hypothetical protein
MSRRIEDFCAENNVETEGTRHSPEGYIVAQNVQRQLLSGDGRLGDRGGRGVLGEDALDEHVRDLVANFLRLRLRVHVLYGIRDLVHQRLFRVDTVHCEHAGQGVAIELLPLVDELLEGQAVAFNGGTRIRGRLDHADEHRPQRDAGFVNGHAYCCDSLRSQTNTRGQLMRAPSR